MLGSIDPALEEAAENLGAGRRTTLSRVTLALARPGLASACLVVFLLCITDFGNPLLVGGSYQVLTTEIYTRALGTRDVGSAAVLSVVLLMPCLLARVVGPSGMGNRTFVMATGEAAPPRRRPRGGVDAVLPVATLGVAAAITGVYAVIPMGALVALSGADWAPLLRHATPLSGSHTASAIWNSVRVAVLAGIIGTALALVTAYVVERQRAAIGDVPARALAALSALPAAVPGTVSGLGYMLAFGMPPLLRAETLWILVASVVFGAFSGAVVSARVSLKQLDPATEEAAVSLGASRLTTFARVLLPLLTGATTAIFARFFVHGLVTVSAVVFLVHPGFTLASVEILTHMQNGSPAAACGLGTILLAITLGVVALARVIVRRHGVAMLET